MEKFQQIRQARSVFIENHVGCLLEDCFSLDDLLTNLLRLMKKDLQGTEVIQTGL